MRRLLPALLILGAALAPLPAAAQSQPDAGVLMTLLEQTPWNGPQSGRRTLDLRLRVRNATAETLSGLTLGYEVRAAPRGRLEYEASLSGDPTVLLFGDARTVTPIEGDGEAVIPFRLQLTELVERGETAVYPMKLELRSDDVPVATIRTPIVFIVPEDEVRPLAVSATVVLAEGLHQDPSGAFVDDELAEAVLDGSWLGGVSAQLAEAPAEDYTLAVSPLLLRQLAAMRGGYRLAGGGTVAESAPPARAAAAVLERLGATLDEGGPALAAYPYAAPSLPALALGGLDRDIANQLDRGGDLVENLLGRRPDPALVRPPFGLVDPNSLAELEALGGPGGPAVLLDPGTATPPEEDQGFNPAASGRLDGEGVPGLEAILPSSSLASVLEAIPDDPVLRAQAALGELAVIHGEEPGVGARGVALIAGDHGPVEPSFVRALFDGLRSIPILRPLAAREFLDELNSGSPLELQVPTRPRTFTAEYESAVRAARADIVRFRAAFPEAADRADELGELVLLAEGEQFTRDEAAGRDFLEQVTRAKTDRAAEIELPNPNGPPFTLTSRNLNVPIELRNGTGGRIRVRVTLIAPGLRLDEPSKVYDFAGERMRQEFGIQATRGGRFPVAVIMCAPVPDGSCEQGTPDELGHSRIVIRATVYNRVALVLTIGAALFLVVGYVRRTLRRRSAA